jgi:hypothetical protein
MPTRTYKSQLSIAKPITQSFVQCNRLSALKKPDKRVTWLQVMAYETLFRNENEVAPWSIVTEFAKAWLNFQTFNISKKLR